MADVTKTRVPGPIDAGLALALTAATNADQECADYSFGSPDVLVAFNSGGSGHTVTVYSAADATGRTNDISQLVGAGAVYLFGPFPAEGWKQANGKLKIKGNNAELKFGVMAGR